MGTLGRWVLIHAPPFFALPKNCEGDVEMNELQERRGPDHYTRWKCILGPMRMGANWDFSWLYFSMYRKCNWILIVGWYHRSAILVIKSMELQCPNTLKSLQVYSVYPIHTATGQLVSNPNRTTLDRERRRYFPSTSRFQKADMMSVAVRITIF